MEVPKMKESTPEQKLNWVRSNIIGATAEFSSPFGTRRITYADTTASGRSLHFIENYIITNVLPFYGNTHTDDSYVGLHSTKVVNDASHYIKKCLGGKDEDAIIFSGSGSTGAIKKLQEFIGIAVTPTLRDRVSHVLRDEEKWVIFVGPYEHHSNLLSWRQGLGEVVEIGFANDGCSIDMEFLETRLKSYQCSGRPMLGSFSAASNVTGIVTDTRALARLLHQYGAFACFDFAASGPYVGINMKSGKFDGYDAVFISPHKFIGGPGTPGVLCVNKQLYRLYNHPPSTCGGGTVLYVNGFSEEDTLYDEKIEARENAGTPQIIQTVRAALAFWIKEYVGYTAIKNLESYYMETALESLGKYTNIKILGNVNSAHRLAIISFLIYPTTNHGTSETSKPLNGRFVAKLLNDLFGIQARGGCACAGPYGHHLLKVDKPLSLALRSAIQEGFEGVKPAWTRISFPYYMGKEEFQFVLVAVKFIALYGHRFLPLYDLDWRNGSWVFNDKAFSDTVDGKRSTHFLHEVKSMFKQANDSDESTFDECLKIKYAAYIDTAMGIVSQLPQCPPPREAPYALRHIDVPHFI